MRNLVQRTHPSKIHNLTLHLNPNPQSEERKLIKSKIMIKKVI